MQIDTSNNIVFNSPDSTQSTQSTTKKPDTTKTQPPTADAELTTQFDTVVQKAVQTDKTDDQAVIKAANDLKNGTLDTTQQALSAAQNILKSGI